MDFTTTKPAKQPYHAVLGLWNSLDQDDWLKLPYDVMVAAGSAVLTLGALLRLTNKETFRSIAEIATHADLPIRTAKHHLAILHKAGFIHNKGRQQLKNGWRRRTTTIAIDCKVRRAENYGYLPRWACYQTQRGGRLSWPSKALLSVIMAQLAAMKTVGRESDMTEQDEVFESFLANGVSFDFSLAKLVKKTGLSRHSVIEAKRELAKMGIIERTSNDGYGRRSADSLTPSRGFRAQVWESKPGHFRVRFTDEKTVENEWKEYVNQRARG